MSDSSAYRAIRQALGLLQKTGVIPDVAARLSDSMEEAGKALREAILAEVPGFQNSGNPAILPGLGQHIGDHLREIRRLLEGGELGDFGFVRAHTRLRAEQHFPLEVTLHAYRCGHRILSRWMREAAVATSPKDQERAVSAVADFAIEYTNTVSTIATSAYVAQTRKLAEAAGDQRTELLSILLSGYDEADGRVARLLRRTGYLEQRQAYCVAVAQPVNAAEMENPARAQRIVDALTDAMVATSARVLSGIRGDLVVAVLSASRRQSGWTRAEAGLTDRMSSVLQVLGPAVLIGISADHPSTSFIPKALQEATIALEFASVAERVVSFAKLPIRALLVHRGADYVQSASPDWIDAFIGADAKSSGALCRTLRAIADADMNIQKAARLLGNHPNTVYNRIERIRDLTGLDGQRYHDLTELLLAADCCRSW
ncbi:MAG: PucR family transcriptional regulator [Rhizobiales bacterium]|nr:PucR family transcriptional regulator [Hyphomicrobiales bacterium]